MNRRARPLSVLAKSAQSLLSLVPGRRIELLLHFWKRVLSQPRQLCSTEPTTKQKGQDRVVPFIHDRVTGLYSQKSPTLVSSQPVPEPHPKPLGTFDAANACRQTRAQEAVVGRLIHVAFQIMWRTSVRIIWHIA